MCFAFIYFFPFSFFTVQTAPSSSEIINPLPVSSVEGLVGLVCSFVFSPSHRITAQVECAQGSAKDSAVLVLTGNFVPGHRFRGCDLKPSGRHEQSEGAADQKTNTISSTSKLSQSRGELKLAGV